MSALITAELGRVYLMRDGRRMRVLKALAHRVEFEPMGPYPTWNSCNRTSFEAEIESVLE